MLASKLFFLFFCKTLIFLNLVTWTSFLRSKEAQEIIEQDPPTYSESEVGDDQPTIGALELLPRGEINYMWQEYRAVKDNEVQPKETEYNPWASLADLKLLTINGLGVSP